MSGWMKHAAIDAELKALGLSDAQAETRNTYLGGSDAKGVWNGDWLEIFNKKTGRDSGDDLSKIFKVQLGHVTERFNILWKARELGWDVHFPDPTQEVTRHPDFSFIACLPDAIGRDDKGEFVIDAKHTGAKAPWWDEDKMIEYYYWQMQHNMLTYGIGRSCILPIWGNEQNDPIWIDASPEHQENYLGRACQLWGLIETDTVPADIDAPQPVAMIAYSDKIDIDMEGNNAWASAAVDFISHAAAATKFEDAKKEIKALVPENAKYASGHGIEASVNKKGSVTIREKSSDNAA